MNVVREHGFPFMAPEVEDEIYNLLTTEVMTEKVSKTSWNETSLFKSMMETSTSIASSNENGEEMGA